MNAKVKVKENNGGGITLYATDIYGQEFAHAGYEYNTESIMKDVFDILNDADTSDWDNDLTNPEMIKLYCERMDGIIVDVDTTRPLTLEEYEDTLPTTKIIMEGDRYKLVLYPEKMGLAGESCFIK